MKYKRFSQATMMDAEKIIRDDYDKLADFNVNGKVYEVGKLYNTLKHHKMILG
jgi:hypothetical protein